MDHITSLRTSLLDLRAKVNAVLDRLPDGFAAPPSQTRNVISGSFLAWAWTPKPGGIGLEHPRLDVEGVKLQYSAPGAVPVIHGAQVGTLHSCFITGPVGAQGVTLIMDLEPKYQDQRFRYSLLVEPSADPREWFLNAILVTEKP